MRLRALVQDASTRAPAETKVRKYVKHAPESAATETRTRACAPRAMLSHAPPHAPLETPSHARVAMPLLPSNVRMHAAVGALLPAHAQAEARVQMTVQWTSYRVSQPEARQLAFAPRLRLHRLRGASVRLRAARIPAPHAKLMPAKVHPVQLLALLDLDAQADVMPGKDGREVPDASSSLSALESCANWSASTTAIVSHTISTAQRTCANSLPHRRRASAQAQPLVLA